MLDLTNQLLYFIHGTNDQCNLEVMSLDALLVRNACTIQLTAAGPSEVYCLNCVKWTVSDQIKPEMWKCNFQTKGVVGQLRERNVFL